MNNQVQKKINLRFFLLKNDEFFKRIYLIFYIWYQICTRNLTGLVELENVNRFNQLIFLVDKFLRLKFLQRYLSYFFEKRRNLTKNFDML